MPRIPCVVAATNALQIQLICFWQILVLVRCGVHDIVSALALNALLRVCITPSNYRYWILFNMMCVAAEQRIGVLCSLSFFPFLVYQYMKVHDRQILKEKFGWTSP